MTYQDWVSDVKILQANSTLLGTEMFANYLEAIVETILPSEETESGILSDGSTSVSLITLGSPMDKGEWMFCVCVCVCEYCRFKKKIIPN